MTGKIWLGPLAVLCFGLFMLRQGLISWWGERDLENWVRLQARVSEDSVDLQGGRKLVFQYEPVELGGSVVAKELKLSDRDYAGLQSARVLFGGQLWISYSPRNPQEYRLANYRSRSMAGVVVGALCTLLGGGIFAFRWRRIYSGDPFEDYR